MKLETWPWYNCLAWAFAQVLDIRLPYRYGKYILNSKFPLSESFIQKVSEFAISVIQVNSLEELRDFKFGFLVYGFFLEEIREGSYTDYRYSGFHVVLYHEGALFHQNGCGVMPTTTSMKELQKSEYHNPLYFAVVPKEQA